MTERTGPNLPQASLVHVLPGRIRLQLAGHRGDAAFFSRLAERLAELPGIRAVRANPTTGSLLILHGAGPVEEIARLARERALFEIAAAPPGPTRPPPPARRQRAAPVPPMMLTVASLAGLGVIQTVRGHFNGNSAESLWNAYIAYTARRQPAFAAGLVGIALYQLATRRALGSGISLFLYALTARQLAQGKEPKGLG
jgi:hypothetical protein